MNVRRKKLSLAAVALVSGALVATTIQVSTAAAAKSGPDGAVARAWSDFSIDIVRAKNLNDWRAARLYAMVNVAMYDAVNGLANDKEQRAAAIVAPQDDAKGDPVVAASQAAHDVIVGLFPADDPTPYDSRLASDKAQASKGKAEAGATWGATVAAGVIAARAADGSNPSALPSFVIDDPTAYKGAPPPDFAGIDYGAAFNTVKILGDGRNIDQEKTDTYWYWALGANTNQPAGAWLQIAEAVSQSRALSLTDTTRLFALETMAMVDTVAPTNITKTFYHRQRPTLAITGVGATDPDADADGNPYTTKDTGWVPRAGVPGSASAEYFSGHSAFAAAGGAALAGFFCDDHIPFTLLTDVQTGAPQGNVARTFSGFDAAATDTGISRVYGGQHFPYSNQAGLASGRAVAEEVLADALLLKTDRTHHGACPL